MTVNRQEVDCMIGRLDRGNNVAVLRLVPPPVRQDAELADLLERHDVLPDWISAFLMNATAAVLALQFEMLHCGWALRIVSASSRLVGRRHLS
jgi:hypothetical protein